MQVIRSAVAYGAGAAFHTPTERDGKPRGATKEFNRIQNACLRLVLGAYRATPARSLETEAACPPIDLYLNKRLADFEARLEQSGQAERIREACTAIAARLRRAPARRQARAVGHSGWVASWVADQSPGEALTREWKARHARETEMSRGRRPREVPADSATFDGSTLKKHKGLRKHKSSVLTQIHTGMIGLRAFLHWRRVPNIVTPLYRCAREPETVDYIIL